MSSHQSPFTHQSPLSWATSFTWAAIYQCILLTTLIVAISLVAGTLTIEAIRLRFVNWDAVNYLYIAEHGYARAGFTESVYIVFFPLYPLLIACLSPIMPSWMSGVALTTLFSVCGHAVFLKYLGESGLPRSRIIRIFLLLALTPVTAYFSLIYTEGLFLFEGALLMFFLRRGNFISASMVGFLAAVTRMPGSLFAIPIFTELCLQPISFKKKALLMAWCGMVPLGTAIYLAINYHIFGDFFYYTKPMHEIWYKELANPFVLYYANLKAVFDGYSPYSYDYPGVLLDWIVTFLLPPLLLLFCFKRITSKEASPISLGLILWSAAQTLMIMSPTFWASNTRYAALILPLYLMVEELTYKSKYFWWVYYVTLTVFIALAVVGVLLFSLQKWVA
jgi:hypothetical protein